MSNSFEVVFPASGSSGNVRIVSESSIIIIGANGSGKTRIGAQIEFADNQVAQVHRISAQKSLVLPEHSATSSLDTVK